MKLFTVILSATLGMSILASAQKERVLVPSVLILEDNEFENVLLEGATKTNVFYVTNKRAVKTQAMRRSKIQSVYIMQPADYSEAMALYENRKYSEALAKFGELKTRYKKFQPLADNHHTLSGFYEMECMRKMEDLEGLAKLESDYRNENLMRPNHLQQIEVYMFWDAVRTKSWARLDRLASDWTEKRVPISHRAQIAYCHAQALEGLKRYSEALNAYATAMTADYSKSEVIVRNSAKNSLRIYMADPELKTAMNLWKTEDEDEFSTGYGLLKEANALARLYVKAGLGAGEGLPADYAVLLKYTPQEILDAEAEKDSE